MAVVIFDAVTSVWPTTEAKLIADATVGYTKNKLLAIERAKRDLYGAETIPAEADIPDAAADWIADKAVVRLIPLAKDFFRINRRVSDSKEGATITYYNIVNDLDKLRQELEANCSANYDTVFLTIAASSADDDVPAISTDGMLIDPMTRAWRMGVP